MHVLSTGRFIAALGAVAALVAAPSQAGAQTVDNQGSEFVLGFMANLDGSNENVVLFITGDVATSGTVSIPGLSVTESFSVTPGDVTSVSLPVAVRANSADGVEDLGVLVTADDEVIVYGLNQRSATTDAFLGLPTEVLGTDHVLLGYTASSTLEDSEFLVVGVEDGTTVTITPSLTTGSRTAGVPYDITLDRLQTYQLTSDSAGDDVSGTIVTSDKPVSVFSGARCTDVPITESACDHLVEQIPPTATWGESFLTVPLATRTAGDIFRIVSRDDATDIFIDGVFVDQIDRGQVFETSLASGAFHEVLTSGPALVAQYSKGSTTDGVTSDPFQMLIPPTEQFLSGYTLTTPAATPVTFTNFINVAVPTSEIASCTIDGAPFSAAFTPIGLSGFSGAQEPVAIGAHNLSCPSGFGAYAYGFASFDSYGYPGGLALEPIAEDDDCVLGVESVRLADRATTESSLSSYGTTELGADAGSGTINSEGSVFLRNRAVVDGDVVAGGSVSLQQDATVSGTIDDLAGSVDLPEIPVVGGPGAGVTHVVVNAGATETLVPGVYGNVIVNGNGTLVLDGSGEYGFETLTVNQNATLAYDEGTSLFVASSMIWRGQQVGEGPLPVSQTGAGWSHFEAPYEGSIIMPAANVRLAGPGNPVYVGESFVGNQLLVESGVTVDCAN